MFSSAMHSGSPRVPRRRWLPSAMHEQHSESTAGVVGDSAWNWTNEAFFLCEKPCGGVQ